jgi:hypothetical protein
MSMRRKAVPFSSDRRAATGACACRKNGRRNNATLKRRQTSTRALQHLLGHCAILWTSLHLSSMVDRCMPSTALFAINARYNSTADTCQAVDLPLRLVASRRMARMVVLRGQVGQAFSTPNTCMPLCSSVKFGASKPNILYRHACTIQR